MQGKVSPERSAHEVYVGVDVCKDWLDVYLHPIGQAFRVANDPSGIRGLKRVLSRHSVVRLVMEATGKHHRAAHRALSAGGVAVAVVNPLRSRLFAEALGRLAKTDRIDAQVLAILGQSLDPPPTPPPAAVMMEIKELFRARQAAVADATALANQLGEASLACIKADLGRRLKAAERSRDRLQAEIERRIASDPALARRFAILVSIPGVGAVAAIALMAGIEELGGLTSKQAAMLAGLAPVACDSGERNGQRHIRGGRAPVRAALYMAALAAARCNAALRAFYDRLRGNGKTFKVAITAVMRKLVVLANTLLCQDRNWSPDPT